MPPSKESDLGTTLVVLVADILSIVVFGNVHFQRDPVVEKLPKSCLYIILSLVMLVLNRIPSLVVIRQ
jgi:hypothetical protein